MQCTARCSFQSFQSDSGLKVTSNCRVTKLPLPSAEIVPAKNVFSKIN